MYFRVLTLAQTVHTNMNHTACRVVVLISGGGTNLQAIIDQCHGQSATIVATISNRPNVAGLSRAESAGISTHCIDHKGYDSREDFDNALMSCIDQYQPDLVVLAGFMRILTSAFVQNYQGRLLNIHPSLLPKFQGLNTHQRALESGDKVHGVTVHFVTEELDGGPNVIQALVPVDPGDTIESLSKKVQYQEHVIYPMAVEWFAKGELELKQGKPHLNNQVLANSGYIIDPEKCLSH